MEEDASELYFGSLLPFKKHEDGLKAFSYAVNMYTSEPVSKHFIEALSNVMACADKQCQPPHMLQRLAWYHSSMEGLQRR